MGNGIMSIESSLDDLAVGTIKVALLCLSPNIALSLSLTLAVCPYIKRRNKSKKAQRIKKGKGAG